MNVEKTAKNKPLIPQKFLQSIMFLLFMCHTTTAITYKFLSLLFTLISIAKPVSVMKTGFHCVHIKVGRVPLIDFQKLFLKIKCFIDYRKL